MTSFTKLTRASIVTLSLAAVVALVPSAASAAPTCLGKKATITSNAKKIKGTKGNDVIVGGPANQEIHATFGNDRVCAGDGKDKVFAGPGNDRVDAGADRDVVEGDEGRDRINGGPAGDDLSGQRGDDLILGGPNTGDHTDYLQGGSGDDVLRGGPGKDSLADGPGRDRVSGDADDDYLRPQEDGTPDRYNGGSGVDEIDYWGDIDSYFDDGVHVSLDGVANDGVNCPQQCEGDNVGADIENIRGAYGNDVLIGNEQSNVISAPGGTNTIDALGGNDIVNGGYEIDTILGGAGADTLRAGSGDDSVDGGSEVDECFGDDGVDTAANCELAISFP